MRINNNIFDDNNRFDDIFIKSRFFLFLKFAHENVFFLTFFWFLIHVFVLA